MLRRAALLLGLVPRASAQNTTTNATATNGVRPPRPWDGVIEPYVDTSLERFTGDLLAWALIGAAVVLVVAPLLKAIANRTPTDLDKRIVGIVGVPAFILVFTFGVVDSLQHFRMPPGLERALDQTWAVVLILTMTYVVYRVWHEIILDVGRAVSKRTTTELDDKLFPLFDKAGGVIILITGLWITVDSFGIDMTFFAAGGAIGGLVIAFAAQDSLSNFFAGVQILLDQPFREGDRIEIKEEDTWGDVVDIGLRSTRIRTRDNRIVVVPNSLIGSNAVINHSFPDTSYRLTAEIGIAYGSDVEKARAALVDSVGAVDGVDKARGVEALFMAFGASSLDFHVRY